MSQIAISTPLGYVQISAASLATAQTLAPPKGTKVAIIRVETNDSAVRWRSDGTAPTAIAGNLMLYGDDPLVIQGPIPALQFILTTGSPILGVDYYGA